MIPRSIFHVCLSVFLVFFSPVAYGQVVNVGAGSYTTQFPGTDMAGRNGFPSGTPYTVGAAANKPVPTNDWWSAKVKNDHADNLFNYPFNLKTVNEGLVVTYTPWGPISDIVPLTVGVTGLNAAAAPVSDFSDWMITMDWQSAGHYFQTTTGIGMPFLYFTKAADDLAQVTINRGTVTVRDELLVVADAASGADFAIYAPRGSVWTQNGNTYTSDLNGKTYWSLAFIPLDAADVLASATDLQQYAYVFPTNTEANWSYDEERSTVTTDFVVETDVKEGTDTNMLLGLLPHQWANLGASPPAMEAHTYPTVRGAMKTIASNQFSVEHTFHGILPTLPYVDFYSPGFSPNQLQDKIATIENDDLNEWTDSYNEGQSMNRLIQTARIAALTDNTEALQKLLQTVKARLEDWLTAEGGEVAFLFYYEPTWTALLGYPAGHGQDGNINDHHFHWGYFIHAAAFVEQYEPGWAAQWGEMINLLVRDAASADRGDELFPYLRNFSPYAGHCWANGFATFPQGNDQESTSESMQFNSSLIHWGAVTGNDAIRDLGIYLYTTEQSAIEEYWLDQYERNFEPDHPYALVSRVWGNSYDNGTFWTADIAASYGIELYPIHGGSLYLGQDTNYVRRLWTEITENTGILDNEANPNLWHDVYWEYLAFIDPQQAIDLYDSYPDRGLKFGVSDAQTYHWLHSMNVLGNVDIGVTADHPLGVAFNKNGTRIYVGQNYGNEDIVITFSDGYELDVPASSLVTSLDVAIRGTLSSNFTAAYPGGSVELSVELAGGTATSVEFFMDNESLGVDAEAPYTMRADNLPLGRQPFYARVYDGVGFVTTNIVTVLVGEQQAYGGSPTPIPGTFNSAHYDLFEGGTANGIAYQDGSVENLGDFRLDEQVDAESTANEGDIVTWIAGGEWLEYTVDVQQAGYYTLDFRYASDNAGGGGPFRIEAAGELVKSDIRVSTTGDWNSWATQTVNDIPLNSGEQVLRLHFEDGQFNLGRLTFTFDTPLDYNQPIAEAGASQIVVLPVTSANLDGSASINPSGEPLNYRWTQVYGPSGLTFSDEQSAMPSISGLIEGVYLIRLRVDDGTYADEDELYVISSTNANVAPTITLIAPGDGSQHLEGETLSLTARATDLNDAIASVVFYVDGEWLAEVTEAPYVFDWLPAVGEFALSAQAFDTQGDSTLSNVVHITVLEAPPCRGTSWNGDFDYEFSPDNDNPTLTFIPSQPEYGTPTCILYYGTNRGSLPGYGVEANVPFRLNASQGEKIYFYYTYSYPGEVERNNSANQNSYVIGTCKVATAQDELSDLGVSYYPNPVRDALHIVLPSKKSEIRVYDLSGRLLSKAVSMDPLYIHDMSSYPAGVYFFEVINGGKKGVFKVVK